MYILPALHRNAFFLTKGNYASVQESGQPSFLRKAWAHILVPFSIKCDQRLMRSHISSELKTIVRLACLVLEIFLDVATCMFKPLLTVCGLQNKLNGVQRELSTIKPLYLQGYKGQCIPKVKKVLSFLDADPALSSVFFVKTQRLKAEGFFLAGKCHRKEGEIGQARKKWGQALALKFQDPKLQKKIKHSLVKLNLISSKPLIQMRSSDFNHARSWEIIASRTFCDQTLNENAKSEILEHLERLSTDAYISPIFDIVALKIRQFADKFNILIIPPDLMEQYYQGPGTVRGFYNLKNSVAVRMKRNHKSFVREMGTYVHEIGHVAMKTAFHSNCQLKTHCFTDPFACHDDEEKKKFLEVEKQTLRLIYHFLKHSKSNSGPFKVERILNHADHSVDSKVDLLKKIKEFQKPIMTGTIKFSKDHKKVLERILSVYDFFPASVKYSEKEIASELIVRVPQLISEISSLDALHFIKPLTDYYLHRTVPRLYFS